MLDPARHHMEVARLQRHLAIAITHGELAVMDQEEFVLVGMRVERKLALDFASLKYCPFAIAMTRGEKCSVMALNS